MSLSITCDSLTGGNIAGVVSRNSHELAFHSKATTVTLDGIAYTGSPTDHDDVRINAAICSSKATAKAAADAFQFSIVKTAADNCRVYVYVKEDSAAAEPSAGTTLWDSGALGYLVTDVVIHIDPQQFLIVVSGALAANIDKKSGVHGLAQSDWGIGYHLSLEGQHTHNGIDHNDIGFTLDRTLIRDIQFFDVFDATIPVADSGVYTDYNTVVEDNTTTAITKSSNELVLVADGPSSADSDVAICSKVSPLFNGVAAPLSYEADLDWTTSAASADSKFVFFLTPDGQVPDDVYIKVELGHDYTYKITERGNNEVETVIITGSSAAIPTKFKLTTDCTVFDGASTAIMKYTLTVNDLAAGGTNNGANKFPYRFRTSTAAPAQGDCSYGFQVQRNESTTKSVTVKVSNFIISRYFDDAMDSPGVTIDNDIRTAPVVWGPITDGIQLNHPELPTAQTRAVDGIIDGSLAPFYADKTNTNDSTAAINHAIEFCIENQMVLFLPAGIYKVSDTLRGRSRRRFRSNGGTENIQRWGPCVITGSTEGTTNIQLANSSPGFNDTAAAARKPILETLGFNADTLWKTDLNDEMSCVISNLTITNGTGNAGAIGIRSQGAQGSVIRNCTIDFTNIGETCLDGGNGSGGYNYNITFKGGNIQVDYQDSYYSAQDLVNTRSNAGGAQPVPGLYGCTFINPVSKSIKYRAFGPLLVLGCHFQSNTTGKTFIWNNDATGGWSLAKGMLILIDCVAEFNSYHVNNIVIETDRSLYIRNLSVEHASVSSGIVKFVGTTSTGQTPQTINGNTGGNWKVLHEYAQGIHPPVSSSKTFASTSATFQYYHNTYIDGSKSDSPILGVENSTSDASAVSTSAINVLKAKHLPDSIVSFETSGILNARDYGVTGDGETDDTIAIETALAAAAAADKFLFFPKGYFKITDKITLPKNAKIIGVHRDFTTIWPMGGEFGDAGSSGSIFGVESNADADGSLHIQDMAFNSSSQHNNLAGGLHIRCPDINIVDTSHRTQSEYGYGGSPFTPGGTPDPLEIDLVKLSGEAGGKIFGIDQGGNWLRSRHCRYFKAENTNDATGQALANELWIYTLNVEHSKSDAMIEFNNCSNFHICGVKSESMYTVVRYADCTKFEHLGAGGTFSPAYPELWVDNGDDKGWDEVDDNTTNTHGSIVSNAQFNWDEKPTYARFVDCDDYRIVCLQDSADSIYNATWVSNYGWYFVPGRDSSNTYYNNITHDTRWLTSAGWPTISQLKNHVIRETITDSLIGTVCDDSPVADMERPIVWQRGTPPT